MKITFLIVWSCAVMTAIHAQKTPKGIDEFERELFVKRVQLLTWVKTVFKKEYQWVSTDKIEDRMQLFGEAKKFLAKYGKTFDDAIIDASSFCEGTDINDLEQILDGIDRNQKLYLIFHLDNDWVLLIEIGSGFNGMYISEWKDDVWSEWEDSPLEDQLNL